MCALPVNSLERRSPIERNARAILIHQAQLGPSEHSHRPRTLGYARRQRSIRLFHLYESLTENFAFFASLILPALRLARCLFHYAMDPFSVALGVLQLTGIAVKITLVLQKKIKVFRNYSREVARGLKGVNRQQKNFLHEIHLLLRLAALDEDDIQCMLEDADHPRWGCRNLQAGLDSAFPSSLDTIQDTIEEIRSILQALQVELAGFDEIESMTSEVIRDGCTRQNHPSRPCCARVPES